MNRTANAFRGEVSFGIEGRELILRPSFENLIAAEEELGSLFALVERASEGSITIAEITALLWHCIEDDPRPLRAEIGSAALTMGLVASTKPVRAILAQVLQGQT